MVIKLGVNLFIISWWFQNCRDQPERPLELTKKWPRSSRLVSTTCHCGATWPIVWPRDYWRPPVGVLRCCWAVACRILTWGRPSTVMGHAGREEKRKRKKKKKKRRRGSSRSKRGKKSPTRNWVFSIPDRPTSFCFFK